MATKRQTKKNESIARVEMLNRSLLYLLVALVFALPLFILPGISEYGYGKTMIALVGVGLLMLVWGVHAWLSGSWRLRVPWALYPMAAFIAVGLFSMIPAMNARVVLQTVVLIVCFNLLLLLVANLVRERKDAHLLLGALLLSGFLVALYAMLQYLGVLRGPSSSLAGGTGQIISTLGNRNFVGGFMSYLLFPSAILVIQAREKWLRALSIPVIAFCFGMAMMIKQQGVAIALILAVFVLIVGLIIFRPVAPVRRSRRWILALLLCIVISFLFQSPSGPLNSLVAHSQENTSFVGRIWERFEDDARTWDWLIGLDMFKDSPLVGVGLGNYKLNFLPYKVAFLQGERADMFDEYIPRAAQAHNEYVQVLAETGILGLLSVAASIALLVWSFWVRMRRAESEDAKLDLLLLACGIATFLAHAFVSFPAHLPASTLALVVFVGLAFSRVYGDRFVGTFSLSGWWMRGAVVAVAVLSLVVSGFAISDLSADMLMAEGQIQFQLGNHRGAEALFQQSLKYDFAPRQTYFHLALTQIQLGRIDDAWENLEKCFTRFIDEAVYLTYANLAISRRDFRAGEEAIEFLLTSGVERQTEWQARYIQAAIFTQRGEYSRATGKLLELAADAPTYELAFIALGDIYAAQGNTMLARTRYEEALEIVVDRLQKANDRLERLTEATISQYGVLRNTVNNMTQQRSMILERLAQLPNP